MDTLPAAGHASAPREAAPREALPARAAAHVYRLFKEHLPEDLYYHTYQHTVEVAKEAARIGEGEKLDRAALAHVVLAAWFHDVGFTETYDGHEEASVRLATRFLEAEGAPAETVAAVAALIRSTHADHEPEGPAEAVLHDADLAHLGKKRKFFVYAARLREEWARRRGRPFTEQEWAEIQLDFLTSTHFKTAYARKKWGDKKARNARVIQERLAELLDAGRPVPAPAEEKEVPRRGIETMFRTTYRNHINLSAIADSKANIMISINGIIMSIIIASISPKIDTNPWLLIPTAVLLISCLVSVVYAVLAARPRVSSQALTLEGVRQKRANILFFGNFTHLKEEEFVEGMLDLLQNTDNLYHSMIRDLYGLGKVLDRKFALLRTSYTVFMSGIIAGVLLFLAVYIFVILADPAAATAPPPGR